MMRPNREQCLGKRAAYFISTQTAQRQPFFRHERWATLLSKTILHYTETDYSLHAYVIMPDHLHLLIVPQGTIEKAVQLVKGGFSFRARRELGWQFAVWQQGFTDHRIRDEADWEHHLAYIGRNPVRAGLVEEANDYPYVAFPRPEFPQGLKPETSYPSFDVRAEARTLHAEAGTLHAEAGTLHAEAGILHAEAGILHAEAGILQAEAGILPTILSEVDR